MRNARRWVGVTVCALVLAGASFAWGQDWPQWRGANRDGKVTTFTAPENWPKELAQKWKVTVGAGDSTPALVGDKLYVFAREGGDEVTLSLDAATGKEVWKDKYAVEAIDGASSRQHPGPRSSPAVADGKVVTLGVRGTLSCLDAATGKVLWRKDDFAGATPKFFTASSPLIADGMVVAQLGSESDGVIVAYDLATGDQKWKSAGQGSAYASPALLTVEGTKQVVTLTAKSVVGVALADGKLLWQIPFAPQGMSYNAATPIVDGQTVIFAGQGRGTKAVKIEKQGDGFAPKELWTSEVGVQFNSPVLKDGGIYGLSERGNLFRLDAATGKTDWLDETARGAAGRRGGGSGFGAVVDAGSVLLALPNNSELVVYKPGKEFAEVAKIKVSESQTYATPVLSGNRIFVKDQDSVALLTVE